MSKRFSFENDPNFAELKSQYVMRPLVLYTGAGVSWARSDEFGLGGWNGFIKRILSEYGQLDDASLNEFHDKLEKEWGSEPWQMADWVANKCGINNFRNLVADLISQIILKNSNKDSFIVPGFLRNAPTLNAITAFCTMILGVTNLTGATSLGSYATGPSITYHYNPNYRIRAIVTSNYDPFLELAASRMYQKPIFGPVAPSDLLHERIPVFHIHGYVPPKQDHIYQFLPSHLKATVSDEVKDAMITKSKDIKSFYNPVLTSQDYRAAWESESMYSTTIAPQIHYLRYFTTLFIGFSFRDKWVLNLLKKLKIEREERGSVKTFYGKETTIKHFTILSKKEVDLKGVDFFKEHGISPIALEDFSELPHLLGKVYQEGIIKKYGTLGQQIQLYPSILSKRHKKKKRVPMEYLRVSPSQYWEDLFTCRDRTVNREWENNVESL